MGEENPGDLEIIPADRIIKIEFECALPVAASKADILEWLSLNLGFGSCDNENSLLNYDVETMEEPLVSDTKTRLVEKSEADPTRPGVTITRRWKEKV